MHILIADDEAPARGELRYILETLAPEATFYEATDGEAALCLVECKPIDVIFLDVHMPGLDGPAVATAVIEWPEPPLIVFATAYDERAMRALEQGDVDYVIKPFDERLLAQVVEQLQQALASRVELEQKRTALRGYLRKAGRALP